MDRDEPLIDNCTEWDGAERRKHCEMVVQLRTMYMDDKKERERWRNDVDSKLTEILYFLTRIKGPYNAGLWAFRIAVGGMIMAAVAWLVRHFEINMK